MTAPGAPGSEPLPRIFGRYLLVELISRGGMGELYLARHGLSGFEKLVVIKKVLPHLSADREFLSRFIDEAQVAVQLQHANVAQVVEVGRVEDEYFLAIEHIEGVDLRATMLALGRQDRRMPLEVALYIAREVACGLAYAHRRTDPAGAPLAVVHCDISPPNLMLSFEGEVKIIDFGIARSARRITETNPDRGFGKFGYLAPEQLLKGGVVDPRTDIYALGVVLFEMLTGRRMFEVGPSPDYRALARMVIRGQHPLPSQVDPALAGCDDLITTALRPDPAARYQTAAEFRDAIQVALVAACPTASSDHLAALVRELFSDGELDRRRTLAEIDRTDLEHFQREIDEQQAETIAFARSAMPPVPVPVPLPVPLPETTPGTDPTEAPDPQAHHDPDPDPDDTPDPDDIASTVDRQRPAAARRPASSSPLAAIAIAAVLLAALAATLYLVQ